MPAGLLAHRLRIFPGGNAILCCLECAHVSRQRALTRELIQNLPAHAFSRHPQQVVIKELLRRYPQLRRPGSRPRGDQSRIQFILLRREPAQCVQVVQHLLLHPVAAGGECVVLRLVADDSSNRRLQILHGPALCVFLRLTAAHVFRLQAQVVQQLVGVLLRGYTGGVFVNGYANLPTGGQRLLVLLSGSRRCGKHLIGQAGLVQGVGVNVDVRDRTTISGRLDEGLECLGVAGQDPAGGSALVELFNKLG